MAESLRQKYLEILNENQSMIDTRSGNVIVKEKMDEVIDQLEKKKTLAEQEVQQTVATEGDEEEKKNVGDYVMQDDSSELVRTGPSPQSATEAEKMSGRNNVEMSNEEVSDLKPDEKALLEGSVSSGVTGLKVSGQSTVDNSRSFGVSNQSKLGGKPIGLNDIIIEEKGENSAWN